MIERPDQARFTTLRRWLLEHGMVIALAGAIGAAGWSQPQRLRQWELHMSAIAQEWRGRRAVDTPVTIVAIDDYSLQQTANADLSGDPLLQTMREWPWPRAAQAELLRRIRTAGARGIAVDLLFDTPSIRGATDDAALVHVLRAQRGSIVLGATALESKGSVSGVSLNTPLPEFLEAGGTDSIGLMNGSVETDGSIRRRPQSYVEQLRDQLGPSVPDSLASTLLRQGGGKDRSQPPRWPGGWQALLDPYGPPRTISTISAWELLENGAYQRILRSGQLRGRWVLVGPTASLFQDQHRTPFAGQEGMPGVEIHATDLANRVEGRALWVWPPGRGWAGLLAMAVLAAGWWARRWDKPLQRLAVLSGLGLLIGLLGMVSVAVLGLAPPLFSLSAAVLMLAAVSTGEATVRLQWQRFRLRQALGRYLSPAVAAEIAGQPAEADGLLQGRSADVVVLMTDIRGFTAMTRRMSESGRARELVLQLNDYFSNVVEAVHGEGGTIDKFIGDATLAIFGAPLNRGSQAEAAAALRAALSIQERLARLNQSWADQGKEIWQQVIVLHFGSVISGNVGSINRMDYTVIGDAVNATSRLEAVAKQCERELILSGAFRDQLIARPPLEHLGDFALRGQGQASVYGLKEISC